MVDEIAQGANIKGKEKMIVYMLKSKIEVEEDRRKGVLPEPEEEKIKKKGAVNSGPTG